MPALSFQEEWLDPLLRDDKRQTTRPQTTRIKVGDICTLYNQQRRRITDKPLRQLTALGSKVYQQHIYDRSYPNPPEMVPNDLGFRHVYFAHLLGKVEITEVYDVRPLEIPGTELYEWARADGFDAFANANIWFGAHYDSDWIYRLWTVARWDNWLERYFDPV